MNDQVMNSFVVSEQDPTDLRISALDMAQRAYIADPAPTVNVILERAEKYLHFLQTGLQDVPNPNPLLVQSTDAEAVEKDRLYAEALVLLGRAQGLLDAIGVRLRGLRAK